MISPGFFFLIIDLLGGETKPDQEVWIVFEGYENSGAGVISVISELLLEIMYISVVGLQTHCSQMDDL